MVAADPPRSQRLRIRRGGPLRVSRAGRLQPLVATALISACAPGQLIDSAPCTSSDNCLEGACLVVAGDSECVPLCADEADCDTGTTCRLAADVEGKVVTTCAEPSAAGAPTGAVCSSGDACDNGLCHDGFCVEICTSCARGEVCNAISTRFGDQNIAVSVCEWGLDWGRVELGSVVTPAAGSAEITFDIAAGTASFTIVLIDNDDMQLAVASLIAPDDTVLIDINDGAADINPGFNYLGAASTIVPSTDDPVARPQVGTYRMVVGTYDPTVWTSLDPVAGEIERVLIIPEMAAEEGGVLDLNLHFAPATGLTATDAPTDAFVTAMLAELDSIFFDTAGVRLGAITYNDTIADHDTVEDPTEVSALLAASTTPGPNGVSVNVFLVQDVVFSSGYSAGRPGPPGVYQTPGSGLVAELLGNGRDTGVLLAHEIGHFLGLYHTTQTGSVHDPISDTPECASGTAIIDCPDYDNLMFPTFPLDRPLLLTDGQRTVLRNNPSLYEVVRPTACVSAGPTYDLTAHGFATGNTGSLSDNSTGSCGGSGGPERLHLYRATEDLLRLDVRVTGRDFAPAVYVRAADCGDSATEVTCGSDDAGNEVLLTLDTPAADAYFIIVDGRDGTGGTFTLDVVAIPN